MKRNISVAGKQISVEFSMHELYIIIQALDECVERMSESDIAEIMNSKPSVLDTLTDELFAIFEDLKKKIN